MDSQAFLDRVRAYHRDGWRLAIINTTSILPGEGLPGEGLPGEGLPGEGIDEGAYDVSWSFAKDGVLEHLRERVLPGEEVPSISASFGGAFLYENEMRELFGVNVTGISVDLQGQLYKTSSRVPFSPRAIRARLEASGAAPKREHAGPKE